MQILSASSVTASITAPTTVMGTETVYPFLTRTSSSAEDTYVSTTSASTTASEFVGAYTTVDPRSTTTQLIYAEYNISTAHVMTTNIYAQMTSSVGESPASTSTSTDQFISDTTTTLKASTTTKTTSTRETASTTGTTSTKETTSATGTTSTTKTTSTTHCTTSTPKNPKKDCVIDDPDFLDQLRLELTNDEGYKVKIYVNKKGNLTFGIGHKITRKDPEFGKPLGTKVSKKRIEEAFKADVKAAIESCCKLFKNIPNLPKEVQLILFNMRFNLGHSGLEGFKNFRKAVNGRNWVEAANKMVKSKWYKQVPNRAKRLEERMRIVRKGC
ncbi:hypothetical protein CHS0354_003684 [Potamilus streckersoni]|uniref:Lysozyme n=1 Tax=Potamilus streckersoni TaxID=2493646 RepID=A0AAE0SS75_9BIVA|nr:hypothetical protein CHS0354_003684 [Potamilus streckersoni]